jgi:hypothetical protein
MKKPTLEDLLNYYILLTISGEEIPLWVLGSLYLDHLVSVNYLDTLIEF